jgi:uncharacterized phage protein (TIGR01671 family)
MSNLRKSERHTYRAWDTKNKRWVTHNEWLDKVHVSTTVNPPSILSFEHEDWIILQNTGLVDKAGKLIFEGDILKVLENSGRLVKVVWFGANGMWDTQFISRPKDEGIFSGLKNSEWEWRTEIIGNIYQDSHLLTKDMKEDQEEVRATSEGKDNSEEK